MEREDDYLKEQHFIRWEQEMDEAKLMKEFAQELSESQSVIVINSPKIVLRPNTKHNNLDYGINVKTPRFIRRMGKAAIRESRKSNLQH